ncbi:MAG: hypothetical protein KatS3mg111_3256 [Pirellulaceae bacterium]|nr:MAG: hypothetical protein KatS3mg111_3256 [Pirellulaceae bacterium]
MTMFLHSGVRWWLVPVLVLMGLSGCGGDKLPTVPVSGVVTLDGKPLEGATVTFVPQSPGARTASALTGSDGRFVLTTVKGGDGAVPGTYAVTIKKVVPGQQTAPVDDPRMSGGELTPEQIEQFRNPKITQSATGAGGGTGALWIAGDFGVHDRGGSWRKQ